MKVLIVVKAYPALSKKYGEVVCTAGITEKGDWIRIYPIPFRLLDYDKQFRKYDWIELDLVKNEKDKRPESYRPRFNDLRDLKFLGRIEPDRKHWLERRKYVIKDVYKDLDKLLIEAKDDDIFKSIAVFKPKNILDFTYAKVSDKWDDDKLSSIEAKKSQLTLFESDPEFDLEDFELVRKLPYKFNFKFEDVNGRKADLMIEDWETGMLYWNSLKRHKGNEHLACEDVKNKYFTEFAKNRDYHFILGTTLINHLKKARNPFVIIGDFRPKVKPQALF